MGDITRNLSLNRFRHYTAQKRGQGQTELVLSELGDCVPAKTSVEEIMEEQFLTDAINQFLYAQPKQKRNIFIRSYWYLDAIRDIAADFCMSEGSIATLLFRMRKELKTYLRRRFVKGTFQHLTRQSCNQIL